MNFGNKCKQAMAVLLLGGWMTGTAFAGPVWVCAITSATATHDDGSTGAPDLGGLARPSFLRVDVDAKQVMILAPAERRGEVSTLETARQVGKGWLLTGVENGRAWTLMITEDGHMTLTATGDGIVWSIFGHAIPIEKISAETP
jgi:hypothetical protein